MDINKNEKEEVTGIVVEALPDTHFRVEIAGREGLQLTYLAGRMKKNHIRVLVGDKVIVELDPYGGKGRITKRL